MRHRTPFTRIAVKETHEFDEYQLRTITIGRITGWIVVTAILLVALL